MDSLVSIFDIKEAVLIPDQVMKTEEEMMRELTEGVQKIFADAVNQPPFVSSANEDPAQKTSLNSKLCCVTQHKYNSTLAERERERECSGKKGRGV